jgi:putative flippase GtrA
MNLSFLKYVITGGLAFVSEYSSFLLLFKVLQLHLYLAASVSFIVGLIISFVLNRMWSFRSEEFTRSQRQQVGLYLSLAAINLGLTNLFIFAAVNLGILEEIAKVIAMALVVAWNFLIFKFVIFKNEDGTAAP